MDSFNKSVCSVHVSQEDDAENYLASLDVEDDNNGMLYLHPARRDFRTNSWSDGHVLDKKMLSPIVERRTRTHSDSSLETLQLKSNLKDMPGMESCHQLKSNPKDMSEMEISHCDDLAKASKPSGKSSSNIERMMRDLFIKKTPDENVFHGIDPMELEKKILSVCTNQSLSKLHIRSQSDSGENRRFGSIRNVFYPLVSKLKPTSSGSKLQKYCHSSGWINRTRTFSDELSNIKMVIDDVSDEEDVWNDICYAPRVDKQIKKRRKLDFRRNSSPETLPLYDHFKSLIGKGQNQIISGSDKLERKKSTRLSNSSSKDKGLSSPWGSRKGSSKSSMASPFGSEKGTPKLSPKLSRENSLQSPGSKKSIFYLESPFGSRKSTPKLRRKSSVSSTGVLRKDMLDLKRAESLNSFYSRIGLSKSEYDSNNSSPLCKTRQAVPKVTSMPLLIYSRKGTKLEQESETLKLKRSSTPKLKRGRCRSMEDRRNDKKSAASGERNSSRSKSTVRTKRNTSASVERKQRVPNNRRQRILSDDCEREPRKKTAFVRSVSESAVIGPGTAHHLNGYKQHPQRRRSRKDLFEVRTEEQTKKVERWLNQISIFEKLNQKRIKPKYGNRPSITIVDYDNPPGENAKKIWKRVFNVVSAINGLNKLSKKSSFSKKKQNSKEADDEVEQVNGPVDPVYSLLKCAADLPRSGGKSPCLVHPHCSGQHTPGYSRYPSGGDSSGNTSKTSSPSSSVSHSPKTRRKKLNARMKSFSLDTPDPPKQLLAIDETTKKKSSSFTNTCFGGKESPEDRLSYSASSLRKKFALAKASSLEMEEKKTRSFSPSPKCSPKSQRKDIKNLYVALYNFKAKEKDDIDLRAGWRVSVTDSSKKDWWKGKCRGRSGYFPATYVIPLQPDQRVFQVQQALNLCDGQFSIKFHKDQIVLQVGEEVDGMVLVRAANNRQALCPYIYLQEL